MKKRGLGIETEYGVAFFKQGTGEGRSELILPREYYTNSGSRDVSYYLHQRLVANRELHHYTHVDNGGRIYVDRGHLEYSSPESLDYLTAARWDAAGKVIMADIVRDSARLLEEDSINGWVGIFKNNSDFGRASYGTHENYQVFAVDFRKVTDQLCDFLVTRQLWAGTGDLVIRGETARYQISQRSRYTHIRDSRSMVASSVASDYKPMIKKDYDALADIGDRIQIVCGDANPSEWVTALKLGITCLLIEMAEAQSGIPRSVLSDPEAALRSISSMPFSRVRLWDETRATATAIQRQLYDSAKTFFQNDAQAQWLLNEWVRILDLLEQKKWKKLVGVVEWATKLQLLHKLAEKEGISITNNGFSFSTPDRDSMLILKTADLMYHSVGLGWYEKMLERGIVKGLSAPEELEFAAYNPPKSRALTRRRLLEMRRDGDIILRSVSWAKFEVEFEGFTCYIDLPDPGVSLTKNQLHTLIARAVNKEKHKR